MMSAEILKFTEKSIRIVGSGEKTLAEIQLEFSVGIRSYRVERLEKKSDGYLGITNDPLVKVDIMVSDMGCSVELKGTFTGTESVCYFTGSTVRHQFGRAFVPDDDCRKFETSGDEKFYLTNSGMILQEKVNKKDLWMIAPPPHVFSFGDDGSSWWGFSIPEVMPVVYSQLTCKKQNIQLSFESFSVSHSKGRMPKVYIDTDLPDSKSILDRHHLHAKGLGLIDETKKTYAWWHNPVYCTWGDQCYVQKTAPRVLEDHIAIPLDREMIMRWADGIRSIYSGEVNYIIDAGWFDYLGDYDPKISEYKSIEDFKDILVELKQRGFKTILWYTPFWVQIQSKIEKEHPEYLIRRRDGSIYRDGDNRGFLDYTNPEVREYARSRIEYMLEVLDADGFKIDMNYVMPLMSDIVLHNPEWGYGNDLWLNVLKLFHSLATSIKEDAFFTISGIESYLQPFVSSVRLNDLFNFNDAESWYDRAEMVSRLMPDVPIDVDGWPSSFKKMREFQFVSPVFGAPVTYYIEGNEVETLKLGEVELNRMASTWQVYEKVPCEHGMKVTIDADKDIFERRDSEGNLKAVALQKSALVCYAKDHIYVTANCDRAVNLPVVDPSNFNTVEKIYRDGRSEVVAMLKEKGSILLNVEDAGNGILYYRISN